MTENPDKLAASQTTANPHAAIAGSGGVAQPYARPPDRAKVALMYDNFVNRLPEGRLRRSLAGFRPIWPGFLASATIAMAATFLSDHYNGPVMLFALLLGIAFNFLSKDSVCTDGIEFTTKTVLRFGVGLLGVRITLEEVLKLGPAPLVVAIAGVALTIGFGLVVARFFRFSREFGLLTGGSVGICGASAALAISSVLPKPTTA